MNFFQFIISFPSLENRFRNGFGWMNRKRSKNELSDIAKKIFEYQFKREDIEIYNGANTKENLTYAEWEERCKELSDTFFSRDGESSGIILFPDTEIVLTSQTSEDKIRQRVMCTLKDWCETSTRKDATGLIIGNYDLKNHLYFCGITNHEIKNTLGFKDSKTMFNFQENDKRFLVFNPSLKIIFVMRLVEMQKGESKLLRKEVDYCIDEVNLLCFLLKDELENTGVIVTGLVTCLGENAHSHSGCKDCGNMVVPFEIFTSVDSFRSFWVSFSSEKLFEVLAIRLATKGKNDKADNLFQAVTKKILGYLAHLQFVMCKTILPVKTKSPTGDITQAELLLDRYQMEIAYSSDKRVWLEGNYGTGKTVVALKKLELLFKGLKDEEVIYYVNFAGKSPLDFLIKQKFGKREKVRTIRGEISLSNTINRQILPKERKLGIKNVHLIVDEYSLQDLSIEEAKSLGQILTEEEKFEKSTVLIAAQPIEMNRVDNFFGNGMRREFSQRKHEVDELIQIMGMKKKILKNVMRTTVEINTLAEITQAYLDNQSNEYVRKQKHDIFSNLPKIEESRSESFISKSPQNSGSKLRSSVSIVSSDSSKNARCSKSFKSQEVTNHGLNEAESKKMNVNSSIQSTSPKLRPSASVTDDSSNPATSSPPLQSQSQWRIEHYKLHKLLTPAPTTFGDQGYYQKTVTKYRYTCESRIGHGINGPLPQLVKLGFSPDRFEQVALIATVLDKIIKPEETERTAVIHFELGDPPLWLKSLFQTTNLAMTTEPERFLADKRKNLILVKSLDFLTGLEFSDVLLILESNEHHLRQFIPEAIARCTSNLTILIIPSLSHQPDTVADLVDEWERHQDESIISILTIRFCCKDSCNIKTNHSKPYCVNKTDASYGVHKNSKWYRNFLKEIKRTGVQDLQPDYKKEEAL